MLSLKGVIDNNNGHEEDVLELKQNLQQLGYYKTPKYGMTGYTDNETFEGVKRFQKDNNLTVDGVLKPGGETESKLNEHLSRRKSFDSPQTAPSAATGTENDDSINRLHEKYKNTLVRRNLLTMPKPQEKTRNADKLDEVIKRNRASIYDHEGCTSYPYLDTKGNITAGCGVNIDKWEDFSKQLWNKKSDRKAIEEDYKRLKQLKAEMSPANGGKGYNMKASYYKDKTDLQMENLHQVYAAKAREIMETNLKYLKSRGVDFFELPEEVQNAHFDMAYNLGPTKLKNEWKFYHNALVEHKYDEMANRSGRGGVQPERNRYVHDLLMKAHNNRK